MRIIHRPSQMVNMNDRFGQVMLENMSSRGCGMPGLAACVDRESQAGRQTLRKRRGVTMAVQTERSN